MTNHGFVPAKLTENQYIKLKLSLEIGLFYYQYDQVRAEEKSLDCAAPRGRRPAGLPNCQLFEVKKKETKSLAEQVRKTDSTGLKGGFMYTSAHERDLSQIKLLSKELSLINKCGLDARNPKNSNLVGWTEV